MKNHQELEEFRLAFPLTKVWVEPDCLVYRTRRGLARSLAEAANELIEKLGLSLSAIPTSLSSQDSICIQSSEVGYV